MTYWRGRTTAGPSHYATLDVHCGKDFDAAFSLYQKDSLRLPNRLFHLVLESHIGRAPGADSDEKHEPLSDIDTVLVDSLKALDPERPIREADKGRSTKTAASLFQGRSSHAGG
jgi:hypothetical protein